MVAGCFAAAACGAALRSGVTGSGGGRRPPAFWGGVAQSSIRGGQTYAEDQVRQLGLEPLRSWRRSAKGAIVRACSFAQILKAAADRASSPAGTPELCHRSSGLRGE